MKRNSLWSALMLAWLGATNVPALPEEATYSDTAVSEQDSDDETGAVPAGDREDRISPASSGWRSITTTR